MYGKEKRNEGVTEKVEVLKGKGESDDICD